MKFLFIYQFVKRVDRQGLVRMRVVLRVRGDDDGDVRHGEPFGKNRHRTCSKPRENQ